MWEHQRDLPLSIFLFCSDNKINKKTRLINASLINRKEQHHQANAHKWEYTQEIWSRTYFATLSYVFFHFYHQHLNEMPSKHKFWYRAIILWKVGFSTILLSTWMERNRKVFHGINSHGEMCGSILISMPPFGYLVVTFSVILW